jgi:hypothetical protein
MQVRQIAPGLWRWTGLHPAWTPAEGGPDGWDQEVGCYFYEGPDSIVLFDPLVPMEDRDRFFEALEDHRRSAAELAERYDAEIGSPVAGVEVAADVLEERVYWIPEHAALVFGDVLVGRDGGLWVPEPWLNERYDEGLRLLRPLLELPVARVLVTHGEPVLEGGREALAAALR